MFNIVKPREGGEPSREREPRRKSILGYRRCLNCVVSLRARVKCRPHKFLERGQGRREMDLQGISSAMDFKVKFY